MINIKIYRYIAMLMYKLKFEFCLSVNFQFYDSRKELMN